MGNPIPIQERSVDPYSSYDSNVVNKLTRIISNGENVLLLPSPLYAVKESFQQIRVMAGKAIIDDVLIETSDHVMILNDTDYYVEPSAGVWDEEGYYYLVLQYQYAKTSPPPVATLKIIKPSQRVTEYNPTIHLFINAIKVEMISTTRTITGIYNFDPDNITIKRSYASGGGGSASGSAVSIKEILPPGPYYATPDDDTLVVNTTSDSTTIILPLITTTTKIVRIVKMSPDTNTVTILPTGPADTIEGQVSILFNKQYESVVLMPLTPNVWIQL